MCPGCKGYLFSYEPPIVTIQGRIVNTPEPERPEVNIYGRLRKPYNPSERVEIARILKKSLENTEHS